MLMLIKRNLLLYFRNKSGVFFSLLGAFISFGLYILFLKDSIKSSWSGIPNTSQMLDFWLIAGTLVVTSIIATLGGYSVLVSDKEREVYHDLYITDLGKWSLRFSYLISPIIIGIIMQIFMFVIMVVYFIKVDDIKISLSLIPKILLMITISSIMSSIVNMIILNKVKSIDTLGKLATVIGTASGFLIGVYMPIGVLPEAAQTVMKLVPQGYVASLFRQTMLRDDINNAFNNSVDIEKFEKIMGIKFEWNHLLTISETYYIVFIICIVTLLIWTVQNSKNKI